MLSPAMQVIWTVVGLVFIALGLGVAIFTGWVFMHWRDVDIQTRIDETLKEYLGDK